MEDVDLHVYHQPNKYMAKLERRKLRIPIEKYYECYEHSGNTVSSTIPIALYCALKDGTLKKGFRVLSIAQGLGYSWGGLVLYF
jgi:3-oxoacyl-[acyl-carrier-protein] synthase-3